MLIKTPSATDTYPQPEFGARYHLFFPQVLVLLCFLCYQRLGRALLLQTPEINIQTGKLEKCGYYVYSSYRKPTPTQTNRPLVTTRLTTRKRIKIMKVIFFFSTQHSLQIALIITGLRIVKIQSFIDTFISLNREPTVKLRTLLGYTQS